MLAGGKTRSPIRGGEFNVAQYPVIKIKSIFIIITCSSNNKIQSTPKK